MPIESLLLMSIVPLDVLESSPASNVSISSAGSSSSSSASSSSATAAADAAAADMMTSSNSANSSSLAAQQAPSVISKMPLRVLQSIQQQSPGVLLPGLLASYRLQTPSNRAELRLRALEGHAAGELCCVLLSTATVGANQLDSGSAAGVSSAGFSAPPPLRFSCQLRLPLTPLCLHQALADTAASVEAKLQSAWTARLGKLVRGSSAIVAAAVAAAAARAAGESAGDGGSGDAHTTTSTPSSSAAGGAASLLPTDTPSSAGAQAVAEAHTLGQGVLSRLFASSGGMKGAGGAAGGRSTPGVAAHLALSSDWDPLALGLSLSSSGRALDTSADSGSAAVSAAAAGLTEESLKLCPVSYPYCSLTLTGAFSMHQLHDWLSQCMPELPAQRGMHTSVGAGGAGSSAAAATVGGDGASGSSSGDSQLQAAFRNVVVGSHLLVSYRAGWASFRSDKDRKSVV